MNSPFEASRKYLANTPKPKVFKDPQSVCLLSTPKSCPGCLQKLAYNENTQHFYCPTCNFSQKHFFCHHCQKQHRTSALFTAWEKITRKKENAQKFQAEWPFLLIYVIVVSGFINIYFQY